MKNFFLIDLNFDKSKINQYISNALIDKITENINKNQKVILYINKRGAYDLQICQDCNDLKKCPKCDISLSIHKNPDRKICHHCGFSQEISLICDKCGSVNLKNIGVGTQQIEDILKNIFPHIGIFRMDSDNLKNVSQKKEALLQIEKSQIIIGTKMITTGFDFSNIGLIGVILLEQEIQIPKYDTKEKVYSNIKQLIGRGGRKGQQTDIVLQTFIPNNQIIKDIVELNYKDFFVKTLSERKIFNYPPFTEMATFRYKNKHYSKVAEFLSIFKKELDNKNNGSYEITKLETIIKMDNNFFGKIIIKGDNIKKFLEHFKKDILSNKDLIVIFE